MSTLNGNGHANGHSNGVVAPSALSNGRGHDFSPNGPDPFGEELVRKIASEMFTQTPSIAEVAAEMAAAVSDAATVFEHSFHKIGTPAQEDWLDPAAIERVASETYAQVPSTPSMPRVPAEAKAPAMPVASSRSFDAHAIRKDFPVLQQKVNGRPLVWLDNAATTQKPQVVIDALSRFYETDNSNVHRGAHTLAARATNAFESAREKVQKLLNAASPKEIIFLRGTTEAINLVAQTYGRKYVGQGDEILVSQIEHHSNIIPWQMLANEKKAILRPIPVNDRGEILIEEYERMLGPRTRIVSLAHVSNALGTILPLRMMAEMAHRHGAKVMVDGAQGAPHMKVDVQHLDVDWYALSGHKIFAPTGVGALYGKKEVLDDMPPWQGGGNMIDTVSFERTTYNEVPNKFEAGTGVIGDAVGLGAAIDYLDQLGWDAIERWEHALLAYATDALGSVPGLTPIGTAADKASVLSFVIDGMKVEDVGKYLDQHGIAVRAGQHCAQPAMKRMGVSGTVRPSLAFYNTREDVDCLVQALKLLKR